MNWKAVLDYPAVSVFVGTLPLLFAIVWGLLQNDRRLGRIEAKQDQMDAKLNNLGERLILVETKLETRLVTP